MDLLQHPGLTFFTKGSKFYFSVEDASGDQTLLTSKPYTSKNARDKGAQHLSKNLEHLELTEKEEACFFAIRDGNKQLLAKSMGFANRKARQDAIDFISSKFALPGNAETQRSGRPATAREKASEKTAATIDMPPKYSFRMEFYFSDPDGPLSGKIEYPFRKEKKTFSGVDMAAIEGFLRTYLPEAEKATPDAAGAPVETAMPVLVASRSQEPPVAPRTPPATRLHFDFIEWNTGQKISHLSLDRKVPTGVRLDLSSLGFSGNSFTDLSVAIYGSALSREAGNKILIGSGSAESSAGSVVKVPLNLAILVPVGLHKIDLLVKLSTSENRMPALHLTASQLTDLSA